ncbi:hypothetical protein TNCV_453781 [Trichonephila clavipes]|nr:hypothetical protein TNCV_453781 [Trichonephila clavipes]
MILALPIECMSSTASSIGKSSDTLTEFRALKSTQSRRVPSFLLTQTIGKAIFAALIHVEILGLPVVVKSLSCRRDKFQLRYRPRHLAIVQNDEVHRQQSSCFFVMLP